MAEILPIRRKTLSNQLINQSIVRFSVNYTTVLFPGRLRFVHRVHNLFLALPCSIRFSGV